MNVFEQVIASIIYDGRCGMTDVAFRTAPPIGGPSCCHSTKFKVLSGGLSPSFEDFEDFWMGVVTLRICNFKDFEIAAYLHFVGGIIFQRFY